MATTLSIFRCIECDKKYDIREIRYRCDCGDLLEVIHDLNTSIPKAGNWKASLDGRMGETAFYRYQDILFPSILVVVFGGLRMRQEKNRAKVLEEIYG